MSEEDKLPKKKRTRGSSLANRKKRAEKAKYLPLGYCVKWMGRTNEWHGIITKLIPEGQIKRVSRAELKAYALGGYIPKDAIDTRHMYESTIANRTQYMIVKIGLHENYRISFQISCISPTVEFEQSQYLLNNQWAIYMRRKRRKFLKAERKRKGLR